MHMSNGIGSRRELNPSRRSAACPALPRHVAKKEFLSLSLFDFNGSDFRILKRSASEVELFFILRDTSYKIFSTSLPLRQLYGLYFTY